MNRRVRTELYDAGGSVMQEGNEGNGSERLQGAKVVRRKSLNRMGDNLDGNTGAGLSG